MTDANDGSASGPDGPRSGTQAENREKRRHPRSHVLFFGALLPEERGRARHKQEKQSALVLNISAGGAMLQLKDGLQMAAKVTLRLASTVDLPGTVVWRRGGRVGLRFSGDPERAASILAGLLPSLPASA